MKREPALPPWADELRRRYLSGEASMFLLHGNVRDLYPWDDGEGPVRYVPLREFLERFLGRSKDIVAYYNLSEGIEFPDRISATRFRAAIDARRMLEGKTPLGNLPADAFDVLGVLEDLVTDSTVRAGVVLDYVETVAPMGELSFMGSQDKSNLVTLLRWSQDPALLRTDNLVLLVTERLSDVHRRVVASAQIVPVEMRLPDESARLAFLEASDATDVKLEMASGALAKVTAGLSLLQIRGMYRQARQTGEPITFRAVSRKKKAIIEQECHGLVEFVDPEHDFSHVGGMDRLKADLTRVAHAIKAGQQNRVPMGMLFVGPMGTGKTYMAEAFAAESGLTCLKFKNFREKWVGSTEGNLDKILQVVEGLGYVLLIIDEADRSMSSGDSDGGTTSRVIARLKEFMSDTRHRGRVVILMMTNRPDKLDTDLKRPGRLDLKIPFFFPEADQDRQLVLEAVVRKSRLSLAEGVELAPVAHATEGYSPAELESVVIAAAGLAMDADQEVIGADHLAQATRDVIPSRDTRMLEFMEMLAVFESSSRRMLPGRYQEMSVQEVHDRLDQLRGALGARVA